MSNWEVLKQNSIVRCLLCSRFRNKTQLQRTIEVGEERVARKLDVSSLMMTHDYVVTLSKLLVGPPVKRLLMKMQRKQRVIEPDAGSDDASDEDNFALSAQDDFKRFEKLKGLLDNIDYDIDGAKDMDSQVKHLLTGVLRTSADDPGNRESQKVADIDANKAAFGL